MKSFNLAILFRLVGVVDDNFDANRFTEFANFVLAAIINSNPFNREWGVLN